MKREQFEQMLEKASKSVQALNRDLARVCPTRQELYPEDARRRALYSSINGPNEMATRRIRQNTKPLLNKLESEALLWLQSMNPGIRFHVQAWRVKIANGAWFKVDICAVIGTYWTAYECKEFKGKNVDRGLLALKSAAHQFPEIRWVLLSKRLNGGWNQQIILP